MARGSTHPLRDLARQIEEIARAHPAYSQGYAIVQNCSDHLQAIARVSEYDHETASRVLTAARCE